MGKRILEMSAELMAQIFKAGERHYEVIDDALPDDATIVGCRMTFDAGCVELCIASAAWDDVADGTRLAAICPELRGLRESDSAGVA